MNSFESSVSIGPDSKYYKMKLLVNAIQLYFQTKRDDTAVSINLHLQSLSVTIDLSIFDPYSTIAPQFFVNLYELMNKMEQRSSFAWNCVDVLTNICRNPSARHALIHTYQFIPSLSRLLSDQMSCDKKIKLLRLMQDLTCGIKISWQIPHLPQLMTTLSLWIETEQEDIVTLSLGVLVNLCYKNLPAIYTLTGNVNVRKIIQICAGMKGPTIELHTCKLLIFLDYMAGEIPEAVLLKLINVTFDSVISAYSKRDTILLRQIIQFFLDVNRENSFENLVQKQDYSKQLMTFLDLLQNNPSMDFGDVTLDNRDPECLSLAFEFLNCLTQIKVPGFAARYSTVIKMALEWIHTDLVSSQALALLKSIAVNTDRDNIGILEPLVKGLPLFLNTIECNKTQDGPDYVEHNLKVAGLFQLLKIMAQVPSIRCRILEELKLDTVCQVFGCVQDIEVNVSNDIDLANIDNINLYVHGLALVNELAVNDATWTNLQTRLLQHKQTHMILAQCLYQSSKKEKVLVLEMLHLESFPRNEIAEMMSTLQTTVGPDLKHSSTSMNSNELNYPVLSITQINKIDSLVVKLRELIAQKQFSSVHTSDIMELYEYKLASMGAAERAAMTSVEAASERCTQLQHRNAQLTAEVNRTHQLLFHIQQRYEQITKLKDAIEENVDTLKTQLDVEKNRLKNAKNDISTKDEELAEYRSELDHSKRQLAKAMSASKVLEENNAELKQYVTKLEENAKRMGKQLDKKEDLLNRTSVMVDSLNTKITDLERCITIKDTQLQQAQVELIEVTKELNNRKQILETITKFALNSQVSESK